MKRTYKDMRAELSRIAKEIETAKEDVKARRKKITKDLNDKLRKLHAQEHCLLSDIDELLSPVLEFLETLENETSHYAEADKRKLSESVLKSHLAKLDLEMSLDDFEEWKRAYKERTAPKPEAKKPTAKAEDAPPATVAVEQRAEQARVGAHAVAGAIPAPAPFFPPAPQPPVPHASERV